MLVKNERGDTLDTSAKKAAELVLNGVDWEIAFFDFVDSYRKSDQKEAMIVETPVSTGNDRLDSLLKSMVLYLCDETNIQPISWAEEDGWLEHPWFVCGLSRLYSFSLVETPVRFKQNNIFVLSNFMDRV